MWSLPELLCLLANTKVSRVHFHLAMLYSSQRDLLIRILTVVRGGNKYGLFMVTFPDVECDPLQPRLVSSCV